MFGKIDLKKSPWSQSLHSRSVNLNRHSYGLLGPQRDASVIFIKSVCMKMSVFLLFLLKSS